MADYTTNPTDNLPSQSTTPKKGQESGKQAMMFQPGNGMAFSGVVGVGGFGDFHNGQWSAGNCHTPNQAPGVFSNYTINGLPIAWPGSYAYFRRIMNDPSVRFVRALAYSPILATQWVVKADSNAPAGAKEAIEQDFLPLRGQFLDDAVRALDYGWAGFEQVFDLTPDGRFYLKRLKALMHDISGIYSKPNGDFAGFMNNGDQIDLAKSLLYTYDGEAGNLYGRGRCQNLVEIIPWWRDANDGAARYDRKIAGVFVVCHYPPGSSIDKTGKVVENHIIAQNMLDAVAAGKPIAVCNEFAGDIMNGFLQNMTVADRTRWRLELLEDKGSRQPGFSDRLVYLDKQKARAYLTPERAAFEAQKSGSKADSESHATIISIQAELTHNHVTQLLNGSKHELNSPVNNVLRMNYGDTAAGTVKIVPVTVDEGRKKFLREITREVIQGNGQIVGAASDLNELFSQADMPVPSDPLDNADLTVKLEGIMAKSLPGVQIKNGAATGDGASPGSKLMLMSKIRQALLEHGINGN